MSSLRNKGKSTGLRMIWIPGGRKHHSKSRHETTNKQLSYMGNQKKSEVWSMGGSRAQRDIIEADADTSLLDGPSVTRQVPLITVTGAAKCVPDSETPSSSQSPRDFYSAASTAEINSKETNPEFTTTADVMPARTQPPTIVTTEATAEIVDVSKENRFALLAKDLPETEDNDNVEISSTSHKSDKEALDSSIDTTVSTVTTPSTTPRSTTNHDSPSKRKHKNHNNNNQSDVNSIESMPDNPKIPNKNMDWMDELISEDIPEQTLHNRKHTKKHKKKNGATKTKELDQLDGVVGKSLNNSDTYTIDEDDDGDEKLVKCLYYTLMCCECSIS